MRISGHHFSRLMHTRSLHSHKERPAYYVGKGESRSKGLKQQCYSGLQSVFNWDNDRINGWANRVLGAISSYAYMFKECELAVTLCVLAPGVLQTSGSTFQRAVYQAVNWCNGRINSSCVGVHLPFRVLTVGEGWGSFTIGSPYCLLTGGQYGFLNGE